MKEEQIFHQALEQAADQRAAFLDAACGSDLDLRERVAVLLRAQENPGSFLQSPARGVENSPTIDQPTERPGTQIGPYKLIELIGEGGMGTVWMAQQTEPVKRVVALKLIKAGMDSRQVIARFEAERQALALMDHANIARVLDASTTSAGRPFFVMDLVKGLPITRYCDEHHLTPRERLELFIPVCQAVQHAHQKGIIHRDLKPSNVLVALYDGKPVPKVIDFGVAKATGQSLTDKTLVTGFGNIVGTLEYMSPEQAEVNQLDIDTRSDIYSLGVLLYELLAGSPPFSRKDLEQAGMLEMLRVIREDEPSKPSTKLSSSEALPSLSANRGTEPAKLTRLIRGELDWIVMKALEKDRNRRYETANGFAADVQRYLADEPVQACPPSVGYRLRKFVRRNKGVLAVTALVLFFLVLLGSGVGWAVRDREARAHEAAKDRALRQARLEEQVTRALTEARDWLDQERLPEATAAVVRAETILAAGESDDTLKAEVQQARQGVDLVAEIDDIRYSPMTGPQQYDESVKRHHRFEKLFAKIEINVDALSTTEAARRIETHPLRLHLVAALDGWAHMRHNIVLVETHRGNVWWQRLLIFANQADGDAVRNRLRTAVVQGDFQALDELAASPDVGRLPPPTVGQLIRALFWTKSPDRQEAAVTVLKKARDRQPDHFGLNMSLQGSLTILNRNEEALSYLRAAEALRPRSAFVQKTIGWLLQKLGRADEASACFKKALELDPHDTEANLQVGYDLAVQGKLQQAIECYKKAIELNPKYALAYNNLGNALLAQKKPVEAIAAHQKAIELDRKLAHAHFGLGTALHDQKKLAEAVAAYQKAIELDPKLADAHVNLGVALANQKKLDEAVAAYQKAIELKPDFAVAYNNLGNTLHDQEKLVEAFAAFQKAIELKPDFAVAHNNLGNTLRAQNKLVEAVAACQKAIDLKPDFAGAYSDLGNALRAQKKLVEAVAAYRKAIQLDPKHIAAHVNLGNALSNQKKLEEAIACFRRAIELNPNTPLAHYNLGHALHDQKKLDEAVAAYQQAIELDPKLALAHYYLGNALYDLRKLDDAIACYRKAIELDPKLALAHYYLGNALADQKKLEEAITCFRRAIELDPKNAVALNTLAWHLATSADVKLRSPADALKFAEASIRLTPENGGAWNTLGVARYRTDEHDAAVAALTKSMELSKGGTAFDWFFLAMAHQKLDQKEEARQWYDRAVEWMDKHAKDNEELKRFRTEAEELLELEREMN